MSEIEKCEQIACAAAIAASICAAVYISHPEFTLLYLCGASPTLLSGTMTLLPFCHLLPTPVTKPALASSMPIARPFMLSAPL